MAEVRDSQALRHRTIGIVLLAVAAAALGLPPGSIAPAQATPPPNIIVITVDDLDAGTLYAATHVSVLPCPGCNPTIFMPNMANFLQKYGMTFANSFVSDSLCCPSRASLLTGMYAHNHGVHHERCLEFEYKDGVVGGQAGHETSTVATWLQASLIYFTGFAGKYLNGYGSGQQPPPPPTTCNDPAYEPPGWNVWHGLNTDGTGGDPQEMWNYYTNDDGHESAQYACCAPGNFQTTVLTNDVADFITNRFPASGKSSFFLWVTPTAPHLEDANGTPVHCQYNNPFGPAYAIRTISPYDVWAQNNNVQLETVWPTSPNPPLSWNAYITNGPSFIDSSHVAQVDLPGGPSIRPCMQDLYQDQLDSLKPIDNMIGEIGLDLSSIGATNNSVIIFTSDNGFFHGEHNLQNKVLPYEESIRVPLVIWTGSNIYTQSQTFTTDPHFVLNTDLAATIADFAGVATPAPSSGNGVDGRTLVPFIKHTSTGVWRKQFLLEHYAGGGGDETQGLTVPAYSGVRTTGEASMAVWNSMYNEYTTSGYNKDYYTALDNQVTGRYELSNSWISNCCGSFISLLNDLKVCAAAPTAPITCVSAETEDPH